MRGSPRKYDYDALRADYERGEPFTAIISRYGINKGVLQEIAARHSWKRPTKTDYAALRKAYEDGVVMRTIVKTFRIGPHRVAALAAENRWKRPVAATEAAHLAVQRDYEAGVPIGDISARHGYAPRSVQSLANTYGWHRKPPTEKPTTFQ